jgi:opacity protein-like surface antigen
MKSVGVSAMATALALGLVDPVAAEEWTGLYLTFGISSAATEMREDLVFGDRDVSYDGFGPYVALGHDWAFGQLTLGVVGDIDFSGADQDPLTAGKGLYGEADWFATLRARVGVPVNDQLRVYGSAGVGTMRVGATGISLFDENLGSESDRVNGTVLGLGLEYAVTPGGHVSAEYLYGDFDESRPFQDGSLIEGTLEPQVRALRLGYTMRF